jgi:hypothetical protein
MWLRNRLVVLPVILFSLAVLAGCGGSGTSHSTPPPSGAFSNTNFNGTYTFSILGEDLGLGNGSTLAMAGSLTACGCAGGTISGGTVDLVDNTGTAPAAAIGSNSTYSISTDGRGLAKLFITPTGGTAFEADVDFVLTSSSHGVITRFDGNGTGSGTIDLQNLVGQAGLANNPFVFSLAGNDLAGDPLVATGAFTLDSSGNIITSGTNAGVADTTLYSFNTLTATPYPNSALSGVVQVGSGTSPGSATLATSFGTLTFDVYEVDSTHLKLIERDGLEILVGDVFTQPSASVPSGNLVFTMAGPDPGGSPFVAGGVMASDGTSTIPSGSEDLNDAGQVDFGTNPATPQTFSGSFIATGGGRFTVTLATFGGGTTFAAYPSSVGLLLQEIDSGAGSGATTGVALTQTTGASIAASQGYGMNVTGVDIINGPEVDEVAEFKTTSTGLTGLLDENDFTITLSTLNLSGAYAAGSSGAGSATFNAGLAGLFYYAADNSTALFISTDSGVVGLGSLEAQTTPAQSALEQPRALAMLRSIPRPHSASQHSKARFIRKLR